MVFCEDMLDRTKHKVYLGYLLSILTFQFRESSSKNMTLKSENLPGSTWILIAHASVLLLLLLFVCFLMPFIFL